MDRLIRSRSASRAWLARTAKDLEEALCHEKANAIEISNVLEELDKRMCKVNEAQTLVEEETPLDDLHSCVEEAHDFVKQFKTIRIQALQKLEQIARNNSDRKIEDSVHDSGDSDSRRGNCNRVLGHARLPKLEIQKFSGDYLEYFSFIDKFNAVVDGSELPCVTKLTYLQSLLTGEALASIRGLSITDDNYDVAKEILNKRYGRRERIIFAHIQKLLSLPNHSKSLNDLWRLYDDLQTQIRCLETLGVAGDAYGVILTPLVLNRIPEEIRLEWAREGEGKESDLGFLMSFLYDEIKRRERSLTFQSKKMGMETEKKMPSSSIAAFNAVSTDKKGCSFCHRNNHKSVQCYSLKDLSKDELRSKLRQLKLCFICFGHHLAHSCKSSCVKCKGRHNARLCDDKGENDSSCATVGYAHSRSSGTTTLMQVVPTTVIGLNGQKCQVDILFDSGADRSFISKELTDRLNLKPEGTESLAFSNFGERKPKHKSKRGIYSLEIGGVNVTLTSIPCICPEMYRHSVPPSIMKGFAAIPFADDFHSGRSVKIDILIGLDQYWKLVTSDIITKGSLVAQRTLCGWMLSGGYRGVCKGVDTQLFCIGKINEAMVQKFWDLDAVGIADKEEAPNKLLKEFDDTVSFQDRRYIVSLPWKENMKIKLLNNRSIAEKRLCNLSKRLERDADLKSQYDKCFREMEENNVIKEVTEKTPPDGPVFYMPHRPVVREDSLTTKVRPVFDASAAGLNGISLNDCLESGPNLIPNLIEILIRFRRWGIALTADIKKAFLQIRVTGKDQHVHRFLWEENGKLREMMFDRVPFGNKASPFLLNATIKHHLSKYPEDRVTLELKNNLYVDDFLTGADTQEEALALLSRSKGIMEEAGMDLTKWSSNNIEIGDTIMKEFDSRFDVNENTKVLGLKWIPREDNFTFECLQVSSDFICTKRTVLSVISKLFDPLGLLSPFTISIKCLFQSLWKSGLDWDEELPQEVVKEFKAWLDGLKVLKSWTVPRPYSKMQWSTLDKTEIHVFCDASEKAYGCSVYLRMIKGDAISTALVMSKARMAPVKTITLPRLELMATVLGARLLSFIRESLLLSKDTVYRCYTDSMVALGWIKGDPKRWKQFVANRVNEIHELSDPTNWYHCNGSDNPADLLTRGISANKLMESEMWLSGPDWLRLKEIPISGVTYFEDPVVDLEAKQSEVSLHSKQPDPLLNSSRWGSLAKAIQVVGWVLRFVSNCKSKELIKAKQLTNDEREEAARVLISLTQREFFAEELVDLKSKEQVSKKSSLYKLAPFLGEDGLMRSKRRLNFSDLTYDEKFPILLPKCHVSSLLVKDKHEKLKHAGVNQMISSIRNRYWVIGLRNLAKKVKRQCLSCQYLDAKACQEPMAPLMEARLKQAPPFSMLGLDYTGPVYCRDFGNKKFYVLLFTCAIIRAVHLELVESLSLSSFIEAFRKFVARRGMPTVIYSDNAKTFKSAPNILFKMYGPDCPKWQYSVPRAPWWGGWWERMVKNMKTSLKKSVGNKLIDKSQLETILVEIEACINSRPLSFVGDDIQSGNVLTPSSFLLGRGYLDKANVIAIPVSTKRELSDREKMTSETVRGFWNKWRDEYVRNLPLSKSANKQGQIKLGSVVLIREDNCPRLKWPIGVVEKLIMGRDGTCRTVSVKTKDGCYLRPIQRIYDLELV